MIFLSALPDEYYFIWQIKVQLINFQSFGIKPSEIHILIGYDEKIGISTHFQQFAEEYGSLASFFFYPDKRRRKRYASSIRPHVIKQHYLARPALKSEVIFYHDSDIVFTRLPDFEKLIEDDIIYVSDTRSYNDSKYIKSCGNAVFDDMTAVVGIHQKLVEDNDENTGGAQYLLKKLDFFFWETVEVQCESLYSKLIDNREKYISDFVEQTQKPREQYVNIQEWCTDMWVVYWNLLKNYTVRISSELDFSWTTDPIENVRSSPIFHNSGVMNSASKLFFKGKYNKISAELEPFDDLDETKGSKFYTDLISDLDNSLVVTLRSCTLVLFVSIQDEYDLKNFYSCFGFLKKYYRARLLIVEIGVNSHISSVFEPESENSQYFFEYTKDVFCQYLEIKKRYISSYVTTKYIVEFPMGAICTPNQVQKCFLDLQMFGGIFIPHNHTRLVSKNASKIFNDEICIKFLKRHSVKFYRIERLLNLFTIIASKDDYLELLNGTDDLIVESLYDAMNLLSKAFISANRTDIHIRPSDMFILYNEVVSTKYKTFSMIH